MHTTTFCADDYTGHHERFRPRYDANMAPAFSNEEGERGLRMRRKQMKRSTQGGWWKEYDLVGFDSPRKARFGTTTIIPHPSPPDCAGGALLLAAQYVCETSFEPSACSPRSCVLGTRTFHAACSLTGDGLVYRVAHAYCSPVVDDDHESSSLHRAMQ